MNEITIRSFTVEQIPAVLDFERELRRQEPDTYFWDIDEAYEMQLKASFSNPAFASARSLLAYRGQQVVGRIDANIMASYFDGSTNEAYLNWICVLKSERHQGTARLLMAELRQRLKAEGVDYLVALTAENGEAARFYDSVEGSSFFRGINIQL